MELGWEALNQVGPYLNHYFMVSSCLLCILDLLLHQKAGGFVRKQMSTLHWFPEINHNSKRSALSWGNIPQISQNYEENMYYSKIKPCRVRNCNSRHHSFPEELISSLA